MIDVLIQFHTNTFFFLHSIVGVYPLLDRIIIFLGNTIDIYVLIASMFFLGFRLYRKYLSSGHKISYKSLYESCLAVLGVSVAWLMSRLIKILIGGLRPFERYPEVYQLFVYGGGESFPSGHATVFAALAFVLYYLDKRVGWIAIIFAFLISISRVVAGVHYPIDMLAGWVIGVGVAYLVMKRLKRKRG